MLLLALLNEQEERKVQAALEATWVHLDNAQNAAIGKHTKFTRRVAATTNAILDALFGERLLSLRAVAVSATLGLSIFVGFAWLWLLFVMSILLGEPSVIAQGRLSAHELIMVAGALRTVGAYLGLFLFTFAILPAILKPWGVKVWGVLAFIFWTFTLGNCAAIPAPDAAHSTLPYLLALAIGVLCDIGFIALARILLREIEESKTIWHALSIEILGVGLALGLFFVPLLPVLRLWDVSRTMAEAFAFASITNILDVLVMIAPLLTLLLLIAHRFVWPVLTKPIYALQRFQFVTTYKKLLIIGGIVLLCVSIIGIPGWLKTVIDLLL